MNSELTYHEEYGILYPNLALPEQTDYQIGKYGNLHLTFLKNHRRGAYMHLLLIGTINEYIHKIDLQAHEMARAIIGAALRANAAVDEVLKAKNLICWVQEMNNCKATAEEIVLREVVYPVIL